MTAKPSPWQDVLWSETVDDTDETACWRTPPEVFRPLQREFGFALDAASRDALARWIDGLDRF